MLQLYKNIKARRQELRLTQTELAKMTGYADKSAISRIEQGKVDLPQSKIIEFADALQIAPGDLMGHGDGGYYVDPETARLADEMKNNPGQRVLMSAAEDLTPEETIEVIDFINSLKKGDPTP